MTGIMVQGHKYAFLGGLHWSPHLQCFPVELHSILNVALLTLNVGQIVKGVGVSRAQTQRSVVTLFSFRNLKGNMQVSRQYISILKIVL